MEYGDSYFVATSEDVSEISILFLQYCQRHSSSGRATTGYKSDKLRTGIPNSPSVGAFVATVDILAVMFGNLLSLHVKSCRESKVEFGEDCSCN